LFINRRIQQPSGSRHDALQFFSRVELQPSHDPEAISQWIGQHAGPRRGAHEREGLQVQLD
jgi:hypothetical protein